MCSLTVVLVVAGVLSGCVTKRLWEEGQFARFHEPASDPRLALFRDEGRGDVLVLYDEGTDDSPGVRRRAYWLEANFDRVAAHRKPRFVEPENFTGLVAMPVYTSESELPQPTPAAFHAVYDSRWRSLTLQVGTNRSGPFELPVHADASGRVKQVLLTPLAVTLDVTIVGAVVFVIFYPGSAEAIAGSSR